MSIGGGSDFDENAEKSDQFAGNGGGFDAPPDAVGQTDQSDSEFDLPPVGGGGDGGNIESSASAQRVLDVKAQIEKRLAEAASSNAMSLASALSIDSAGVQGVGLSGGGVPGQSSLIVYVESEANEEQVRREIVDTMGVRAASTDDLSIEIEVTGPIEANGAIESQTSNRMKFRPAPAGTSRAHERGTASTIGGWARGSSGKRRRRILMVSNHHVIADSNAAKFGDAILQPGPVDGGTNPADRVAILERFEPINYGVGAANFVDASTSWCWPDLVRRDHVYHRGGSTPKFFKIGNTVIEPRVNMVVGKTGRTTDLTQGFIRAIGVSINITYPSHGVAHFRDQFAVRSTSSDPFSAGGDSGAIVWQWDAQLSPVGLIFAGGGGTSFCNRMSRVLTALEITMFEES